MTQLYELAKPFPIRVVQEGPGGYGVYVQHHFYVQRLLMHLGAYSFECVEILRGRVKGKDNLGEVLVGVVARLTVTVDGERMVIEECGDVGQPDNWDTDGARLKDAMSDALKRCCARIGLGTHLYADDPAAYVLAGVLKDREQEPEADGHEPARVKGPRPVVATADPTLLDNADDPGRPYE